MHKQAKITTRAMAASSKKGKIQGELSVLVFVSLDHLLSLTAFNSNVIHHVTSAATKLRVRSDVTILCASAFASSPDARSYPSM